MKVRLCERTGKRMFKRHQAAESALAWAARRLGEVAAQVPQSVYRCEHCRRWHLTSMTRGEYLERKARRG